MAPEPGLFLDRDGTINREVDYLGDPDDLELIPGVADAIRRAHEAGYRVVVITNQSGIARGLFGEKDLIAIHARLDELLAAEGAAVEGYYSCPHHPDFGGERYQRACDCRKPAPGLLLEAARDLDLDLARSACVGDSLRDLEAARRAGIPARYLVATGKGQDQRSGLGEGDHFVADLAEAVDALPGRS